MKGRLIREETTIKEYLVKAKGEAAASQARANPHPV